MVLFDISRTNVLLFITMVSFEMLMPTDLFVFCLTIYHSVIRRRNRWRLLALKRGAEATTTLLLPRCWSLCSVFAGRRSLGP